MRENADDKKNIEDALEKAKEELKSDNKERIDQVCEELSQAAMKIGEAMSKSQQEPSNTSESGSEANDEKVVDAEYEEVKEDDKRAGEK